jgi:uncharacterized membrane protein YdbT with pleckstrin-like domain
METHPGEQILFEGHPSWRSILDYYFKGIFLTALAGGITAGISKIAEDEVKTGWVVTVVLVVFGIVLLIGLLKRIATTYAISNQRLHIRRGIISRKVQETRLERVQNVNVSQSIIERMLMIGTVDFDTAGTGTADADFAFRGVARPEQVMREVDKAQRAAAHDTSHGDPAPAAGAPTAEAPGAAPAPDPPQNV